MGEFPDKPLSIARKEFFERLEEGTKCPCCGRFGKLYARSINSSIALDLIDLYHLGGGRERNWVHRRLLDQARGGSSREHAKARWWRLVEQQPGDQLPTTPTSGIWRLTVFGVQFVENRCTVPRKVFLWHNRVRRYSTREEFPSVRITDCLKNRFNYAELMGMQLLPEEEEPEDRDDE